MPWPPAWPAVSLACLAVPSQPCCGQKGGGDGGTDFSLLTPLTLNNASTVAVALPVQWQWGHVSDGENVAGGSPVRNLDEINLLVPWDLQESWN